MSTAAARTPSVLDPAILRRAVLDALGGDDEDLQASAVKAVGLDDFGTDDDNYREALDVLLESYRRDADFTELGSKMSRFFLRNALVARLLSEASWKQYPQHADVVIERPIFVTGLPRTGTTISASDGSGRSAAGSPSATHSA